MILSIFSIGTLSFLLLELIPGEPETTILGIEASVKDLGIGFVESFKVI